MRTAAIVVLLSALFTVATGTAAKSTRSPSLILFNAPPEVETAFGVIRPSGEGRRMLSHDYSARRWSPNGRQILAYGGPTGLAILDEAAHLVRALPMDNEFLDEATWSPDGRWVAGTTTRCQPPRDFCADLRLLRTDGTEDRVLVSAGLLALGSGVLYDWAPNGRALAYSGSPTSVLRGEPSYKGIVMVSLAGAKLTRKALRGGAEPSWAPSGRRLAFSRHGQIYSVRRDGRGLTRVSRGAGSLQPTWSPDGRRIAYLQNIRGGFAVQVLDLRRGRTARVARVSNKVPLVWSPKGARLTWSDFDAYYGTEHIFVARADGRGKPRQITEGWAPDWR
jgi:Tol biopolymer transport system component